MYTALPSALTLFKNLKNLANRFPEKNKDHFWAKFDLFYPDTGQKTKLNEIKYVLFYSINDPLIPGKKTE